VAPYVDTRHNEHLSELSLSIAEMRTLQTYFRDQQRDPTDIELETLAQTWSEHCKHKTLTGIIEYQETGTSRPALCAPGKTRTYNNLLKETVFRATQELKKKWCISVFQDNAGIIEFDKDYGIAFKVETHNHPSALEPYGGAATGIGGVIRDPLGTGLGAKPILNTDVFCFAPPDFPYEKLPKGVLHPRLIFKGVRAGVADYGNRLGIWYLPVPTHVADPVDRLHAARLSGPAARPACFLSSCDSVVSITMGMAAVAGSRPTTASRTRRFGRRRCTMTVMAVARRTLAKDLRLEWRAKDAVNSMLFFALLVVVIFSFSFDPTAEESRRIAGRYTFTGDDVVQARHFDVDELAR